NVVVVETERTWVGAGVGVPRNLPALVDQQSDSIGARTERPQVLHDSVLPEKRTGLLIENPVERSDYGVWVRNGVEGEAHQLTLAVDRARLAFVSAIQRSEINDMTIPPERSSNLWKTQVQRIEFAVFRISGDQSVIGDPARVAVHAVDQRS